MPKVFSLLLTLALVQGGMLGGAFAGGVALGKSQAPVLGRSATAGPKDGLSAQSQFSRGRPAEGEPELFGRGSNQEIHTGSPGSFREQFPSRQDGRFGERPRSGAGPQGRREFQGGQADRPGSRGFSGAARGPSISGTVTGVEGNQVTVTAHSGAVAIQVITETVFQKVAQAVLDDIQQGVRVRVFGRPGGDGVIRARSIVLLPVGDELVPARTDSQRKR